MKVTPLEIRQKEFAKVFRGYDKDEVDAFLQSLSQEWERVIDEMKELKMRMDASEREVVKLREVESSLFKTLKTAEDTGANLVQQANKTAELHLKETQIKAEALMNDAKFKAKSILEEADTMSRTLIDDMESEARQLIEVCKQLESHRENLINELRHITNDVLIKVQKVEEKGERNSLEMSLNKLKSIQREVAERNQPAKAIKSTPKSDLPASNTPKVVENEEQESRSGKSFFDELG